MELGMNLQHVKRQDMRVMNKTLASMEATVWEGGKKVMKFHVFCLDPYFEMCRMMNQGSRNHKVVILKQKC